MKSESCPIREEDGYKLANKGPGGSDPSVTILQPSKIAGYVLCIENRSPQTVLAASLSYKYQNTVRIL